MMVNEMTDKRLTTRLEKLEHTLFGGKVEKSFLKKKHKGTLRGTDISKSLPHYTNRTLRNAIKLLIQLDLMESQPDLRDMRRRIYIQIFSENKLIMIT